MPVLTSDVSRSPMGSWCKLFTYWGGGERVKHKAMYPLAILCLNLALVSQVKPAFYNFKMIAVELNLSFSGSFQVLTKLSSVAFQPALLAKSSIKMNKKFNSSIRGISFRQKWLKPIYFFSCVYWLGKWKTGNVLQSIETVTLEDSIVILLAS